MNCPRCQRPTRPIRIAGEGGAYREALRAAFACAGCRLTILDRTTSSDVTKTLSRSMLVRDKQPAEQCPRCPERLNRLTLSWDAHWVEIEECASCHTVVFDGGELDRLRSMIGATKRVDAAIRAAVEDAKPDRSDGENGFEIVVDAIFDLLAI